jgi:hypothetical protein
MSDLSSFIHPEVPPSGDGCVECDESGSWWVHLRRCAACGHIGCCDDSLERHATSHWRQTGHRIMRSFEPGEDWFWDFETESEIAGPPLAPPQAHPGGQGVPGPTARVPGDWQRILARRAR